MKKVKIAGVAIILIAMMLFIQSGNAKAYEQQMVPCYMDYGELECMCFGPAEQCILTYCSQGCEGVIIVEQ